MKVVFEDQQFSFQLLRLLGSAVYGGSDIGECLSTAYRIKEGDFESWYTEWLGLAMRIHEIADGCEAKGHDVSAAEAYMRASNYYRVAEFYLHSDPKDPRIAELSTKSVDLFRKALALAGVMVEMVDIPYEGTTLPGYFYPCDGSGQPRPTLILQTGFDGTQEELYLGGVTAVTRRGFNCLTFEGPGQGRVIREQGLPFRPDWEHVVTPVVDYALSRGEVIGEKVALEGVSFGGYMAPRAAAFEHRLAACIANGGVYDFMGSHVPEGMERGAFFDYIKQNMDEFNKGMLEMMKTNTDLRWSVTNGMFTFGTDSPGDWMLKASEYNLEGVANKIKCPTLVIDTENELNFTGQAKRLFDALTCPKTWMLFTTEEGAEEHCQIGAAMLSSQRIFDWLEETMS